MKNEPVYYIERFTKEKKEEQIYGEAALRFLYGKTWFSKCAAFFSARLPWASRCFGYFQKLPRSRKKILPFIKKYCVDPSEFTKPIEEFCSFNDFFCRTLKKEARPIHSEEKTAIIPTDGRFLFYPNIDSSDGFIVKGKRFLISHLLKSETLAEKYRSGSMVLGRLCPTDYHRFHFPCDYIPEEPRVINGWLYSVNPISVRQNLAHLTENKRVITPLRTKHFGDMLFIEVGATSVGTIHQTFTPHKNYSKGDEKGYFSFGGSALILLFEKERIAFDADLIETSLQHMETRCLLGQSMGMAQKTDEVYCI